MGVTDADRSPIVLSQDTIDVVNEFPYLGSVVGSSGRIDADNPQLLWVCQYMHQFCRPRIQDNGIYSRHQ